MQTRIFNVFAAMAIACSICYNPLSAAGDAAKKSRFALFLDLGGPGGLWSANASLRVIDRFAINAGGAYYSITTSSSGTVSGSTFTAFVIPVSGSLLLLGKISHFLEAQAGVDIIGATITGTGTTSSGFYGSSSGSAIIPFIGAGYRYWPYDGGFFFRVNAYYIIATGSATTTSSGSSPWAGLSFGYAF